MNQLRNRNRGWTIAAIAAAVALTSASPAAAQAGGGVSPIALPGERLYPESITSIGDGTFYVGSPLGGVLRVLPGKAPEPWIAPGAFGSRAVFGLLADEKAGMLWVCSNDLSAMGLPGPGTEPGSTLKGFDLATGEGRVSYRIEAERSLCNDIAVAADGSVYVTNTMMPQIWRLPPGGTALELWLTYPRFQPEKGGGLDGIAFGADGAIYVTGFGAGELFRIAVVDGRPGAVTLLSSPRKFVQPDALRPVGDGSLVMTEGGGGLHHLRIEGDRLVVTPLAEGVAGPTGVTVHDGVAWMVAGQVGHLFNPATRSQKPPAPFAITPHALPPGR